MFFRLSREHYLNTEEFIDAVANDLKARLVGKSSLYVLSFSLNPFSLSYHEPTKSYFVDVQVSAWTVENNGRRGIFI